MNKNDVKTKCIRDDFYFSEVHGLRTERVPCKVNVTPFVTRSVHTSMNLRKKLYFLNDMAQMSLQVAPTVIQRKALFVPAVKGNGSGIKR